MYTFIFSRRSFTVLLTASVLAGGLLFSAGLLVGLVLRLPEPAVRRAALGATATPGGKPAGSAPPAQDTTFAPPRASAAGSPDDADDLVDTAGSASGTAGGSGADIHSSAAPTIASWPSAAGTSGAAGDRVVLWTSPVETTAATATPAAPVVEPRRPADEEAAVISHPGETTPSAPGSREAVGRDADASDFSVQVAAYFRPAKAQPLLTTLSGKGYSPYLVDLSSRLCAVRFGHFADRVAAGRAAAEFRRKERLEALVQP